MNDTQLHQLILNTIAEKDPKKAIAQALGDGGEGTVDYEMQQKGWGLSLYRKSPNQYRAVYWHPEKWNDGVGEANTPSFALSKAAAKALGLEVAE